MNNTRRNSIPSADLNQSWWLGPLRLSSTNHSARPPVSRRTLGSRHALACLLGLVGVLASASLAVAQVRDDTPMKLSGISPSEAYDIKDDLELDYGSPLVNRLLYRAKKSSIATREEYSGYSRDVTFKEMFANTIDYRFWMMRRYATITKIEKYQVPNAPPEAEIQHYYVCYGTLQTSLPWDDAKPGASSAEATSSSNQNPGESDPTYRCRIITRTIPKRLKTNNALNELISFDGFLYCRTIDDPASDQTSGDPSESNLVFVADGIRWHPQTESIANASEAVLGQAGFDVGLLDQVQLGFGKGLTTTDTEPFFQMIKTVSAAKGDRAISRLAMRRASLTDLLKDSRNKLGTVTQFTAVCRTCTKISVPYPDIQQRLGVESYYQLVLFPKLDQKIIMTEGNREVELERYPVTVCCVSLPEGLSPEDLERRRVSIDGFFYRIWKFETGVTDEAGISGALSPLIIAAEPTVLEAQTADLNRYVLIFVISVIAGIGLLLTYLRVTDKRDKTHAETLLESLPDKIDVDGLSEVD